MTTSTLQVLGAARPEEARLGLRAGSRAGSGPHRSTSLAPRAPPPVSVFTGSEPRAASHPERPDSLAGRSPPAAQCCWRPGTAAELGPAVRLLALPPPPPLP